MGKVMNRKLYCQNQPGECTCVADMMRHACPKLGGDWMSFLAVMMKPGSNIKSHKHVQHTVLYYPEDCGEVVLKPSAGSMLYLPPGVEHRVTQVTEPRLSIAMLIDTKEPK